MKKVNIIGAGISGLAIGCYLQMNGYQTELFEKHNIPGGLCTSWKRGDYNFDGCIHWLLGSDKTNAFYRLWSELIPMKDITFLNHSIRVAIEVKDNTDKYGNKVFYLYTDTGELERYLLDLSPEDHIVIKEFIAAINYIKKYDLPPMVDKAPQVRKLSDWLKLLHYLPLIQFLNKWNKITNKGFAKGFQNPFLKEVFELLYDGREVTLLMMLMQLVFYSSGCAGYPENGSLEFARHLEKRYTELGGKIYYNSGVNKIITENNTAIGIQTEDNQRYPADIVISAADWHYTVFEALEGKYVNPAIVSLAEQRQLKVFDSALLISLGVATEYKDVPYLLRFPLDEEWLLADGELLDRMEAHIYNYDKTLAPEGKTVIIVTITTKNADFWIELRKNKYQEYLKGKREIADRVITILDKKLGNVKEHLEIMDVATPATFYRYTGNWKGSIQGWMPTQLFGATPIKNTLPGLKNFYMTGQWLEPGGGVPIALMTSRNLAQILCKKDKKTFRTDRM